MSLTRREFVGTSLTSAAAFAAFPSMSFAATADEAIAAYTGGAATSDAGITLIAPEIAENGNTVQIEVSAPGAEEIIMFAAGNPNPNVATFKFGPMSGSQAATTRIRLAGEQDVIAIAKMPDGSFLKAVSNVKVTIGGCGG
ncbi:thiosulfate oxidation carrier protein SoxY [Rhodobacteraceae bacterium XHP0102]|jgi:sulfur-oxidizing protein SoxY|nr:thiosulfate oxidation carrier protein SoxY [Rhodobacteraceae bacterium XHP0102]